MAELNSIKHYPVDNGDMTLIQIGTKGVGKTVLIDMKIRESNETQDSQFDVARDLYEHLPRNSFGAPYVDLFVLTHPDNDHCLGFEKYMHSDDPSKWMRTTCDSQEKIIMNEIWFSEVCTKRASEKTPLEKDAKAFRTEAKRRRKLFEDDDFSKQQAGNRLKVVEVGTGSAESGENWDLDGIVINRGEEVPVGDGSVLILAPLDSEIFDENHQEDKNNSSIVMRWTVNGSQVLIGGDATAHIWRHIWEERKDNKTELSYDLLLAPHHCSWRSLSYDSASKIDNPRISPEAKLALSQANPGAYIVSSSKKIDAEQSDPPSHLAKEEYVSILDNKTRRFVCLADSGSDRKPPEPRDFLLNSSGVSLVDLASASPETNSSIPKQNKPIRHG